MANINKIQVNGSVYDVGTNVYKDAGVSQQRFIELLDRDFYIPTLPSPPTADTLTYVDTDASQCRFSIGQQCRVADPNSDKGYTFYQLYAIDNLGKAVWEKLGGGEVDLRESVVINLTSNQAQPDNSLIGATVTIKTVDGHVVHTSAWDGTAIQVKLAAATEHIVTASPIDGYTTPAEERFTTSAQGNRVINMSYNCCIVTVNIDSNQQDKADLTAATATVAYTGKQHIVNRGDTIKVPLGTEVTVTGSAVDGYSTPAVQKFTEQTQSKTVSLVYNTCVVTARVLGLEDLDPSISVPSVKIQTRSCGEKIVKNGQSVKLPYGEHISYNCTEKKVGIYSQLPTVAEDLSTPSLDIRLQYSAVSSSIEINNNQNDNSERFKNLRATLSYGTHTEQIASLQTFKHPFDEPITITFPEVEGYKKPDDLSFTVPLIPTPTPPTPPIPPTPIPPTPPVPAPPVPLTSPEPKVYTYKAELLQLVITANGPVRGLTATVNNKQYTVHTGMEANIIEVPFDVTYSVAVNAQPGIAVPPAQTFTANQQSRLVMMEVTVVLISEIVIDQDVSDPATMISGDINGAAIKAIRRNSHRYLGKMIDNGPMEKDMTICQLDDTNSNKYYNGQPSVLTGEEGDVFMRLPEFYFKITPNMNKVTIGFAFGGQPDSSWKKWEDTHLIGVYKACVKQGKMYSISGASPSFDVLENMQNSAFARAYKYNLVKWCHHWIMAFLYCAMYGNTNSQEVIGSGMPEDYLREGGQTNSLGMTDTKAPTDPYSQHINFWGLENWWGGCGEMMSGVKFTSKYASDGTARHFRYLTVENNNDGAFHINLDEFVNHDKFITRLIVGSRGYFDIYPDVDNNGTETTYFCDIFEWGDDNYPYVARACTTHGSYFKANGIFAMNTGMQASSGGHGHQSSRLAYQGKITEEKDVNKFKAIPIIN